MVDLASISQLYKEYDMEIQWLLNALLVLTKSLGGQLAKYMPICSTKASHSFNFYFLLCEESFKVNSVKFSSNLTLKL